MVTFWSIQCHPGLTYIFNFWHLDTLALRAERQGVQMSEIKNVGQIWMAKCNQLTSLPFKGLRVTFSCLWRLAPRKSVATAGIVLLIATTIDTVQPAHNDNLSEPTDEKLWSTYICIFTAQTATQQTSHAETGRRRIWGHESDAATTRPLRCTGQLQQTSMTHYYKVTSA